MRYIIISCIVLLLATLHAQVEQPDVESSDEFGPEWFIGFNVAPVVEDALAKWFQ